jgi:hypothetical protein
MTRIEQGKSEEEGMKTYIFGSSLFGVGNRPSDAAA